MQKTIQKQLARLNEDCPGDYPFQYTFKEMIIPTFGNSNTKAYDLKFELNYYVVHVHIIYKPDYPFSAPFIYFSNLHSSIKHPLLKDRIVNVCDFSPAIDIKQQIVNCYLIFSEILENQENEELVELGEVTFPTLEEEIESYEECQKMKEHIIL